MRAIIGAMRRHLPVGQRKMRSGQDPAPRDDQGEDAKVRNPRRYPPHWLALELAKNGAATMATIAKPRAKITIGLRSARLISSPGRFVRLRTKPSASIRVRIPTDRLSAPSAQATGRVLLPSVADKREHGRFSSEKPTSARTQP